MPPTSSTTSPTSRKPSPSRILQQKKESDILSPKPIPFAWNGTEYEILPMPDALLMHLTEDFGKIMDLLITLKSSGAIESFEDALPYVPDIVRILFPSATTIIATCLGLDEQTVSTKMRAAKKLEALTCIVEAEDLPLICRCFTRLTNLFPKVEISLGLVKAAMGMLEAATPPVETTQAD